MANPRSIARLEARILERAAHAIEFELNDPRGGFITITRVELSRDVSTGKIYYSVLGDAGERSRIAHMLKDASGYLQRLIGRVLKIRRIPHLTWVYDDSVEYAAELDEKIFAALKRDERIQAEGAAPESLEEPPAEDPAAEEPRHDSSPTDER